MFRQKSNTLTSNLITQKWSTYFRVRQAGNFKFELKGKKLKGGFALVRLKNDDGKSWLLIKHRDKYAVDEDYNSEDYSKNKRKEDKQAQKINNKK